MNNSVSNHPKEPDKRALRFLALVLGRRRGLDEEDIAAGEGFASARELYARFAADGYPICETCGALHVGADHYYCAEKLQENRQAKRRARLGGQEGAELPPAAGAVGLFRAALEVFERDVGELERRRERLVGEGNKQRFIVERALPDDAKLYRKDHSEDEWRELCEGAGEDPAQAESLDAPAGVTVPGGASPDPPEPLARLIGVYLLSGLDPEPLLRALHPDPEGADRNLLEAHIEGVSRKRGRSPGLKGEARSVARLVRGGELRRGAPALGLDPREEEAAAWIRDRLAQGASEEEILEELRTGEVFSKRVLSGPEGETEVPLYGWSDVTLDDLRRLKGY
jgi:hypothetical protein